MLIDKFLPYFILRGSCQNSLRQLKIYETEAAGTDYINSWKHNTDLDITQQTGLNLSTIQVITGEDIFAHANEVLAPNVWTHAKYHIFYILHSS